MTKTEEGDMEDACSKFIQENPYLYLYKTKIAYMTRKLSACEIPKQIEMHTDINRIKTLYAVKKR